MARKFRCRSGVAYVVIPGLGKVNRGRVIEGDQYARLCPQLLEEVKASDSPPVRVASVAVPVPPPMVVPSRPLFVAAASAPVSVFSPAVPSVVPVSPGVDSIVESESDDDSLDEQIDEPSMVWTKAQLTEYAEVLGVDVEPGMTKAQILEAIRKLEAELEKEPS